ncbi:MAG: glycosyltransferase [Actinobacteria bacterium]|nr:glycosyltransferase [Actinomycetota bacterium]
MTGPIKVLEVLGTSTGGVAAHVARVTEELNRDAGCEIEIAGAPDLPAEMPGDVHPLHVPKGPLGHRQAVKTLRTLISRRGYQVVHGHGLRAGIDAARAARDAGVPVVVTVHNLVQPEIAGALKASAFRMAEPLVAKLSDRTLAVSEEIADRLRSAAPARAATIEVLHLGVGEAPAVTRSSDDVRRELRLSADDQMVVTVARLVPQKALHVMLGAIARLPGTVHLVILGEGRLERDLRAAAERSGIAGRVHFLGFRPDVPDHLAAADAYVLSSIWEGVPLSAQEAILLGTPIVATNVGGMPELIEDRVSGRLVPRDDPEALASALSEVLDDRTAAEGYARKAAGDLRKNFSTSAMLARLTEIYRELAHEA